MEERPQSLGEEIANSVSHGVGLIAALAALPVLLWTVARAGSAADIVGATIFVTTLLMLYTASTIYHALPHGRAKRVFMTLDHSAIYLFIAGSYTPFALGALYGPWGWTLFGAIWSLALLGVLLKCLNCLRRPIYSTGLYLAMGWLVLIAAFPLAQRVSLAGIGWLAAGGIAYTAGVYFFATDSRHRFGHSIWHLFVLAGTGCHFWAILNYAAVSRPRGL